MSRRDNFAAIAMSAVHLQRPLGACRANVPLSFTQNTLGMCPTANHAVPVAVRAVHSERPARRRLSTMLPIIIVDLLRGFLCKR